jgi:hypothetical protein
MFLFSKSGFLKCILLMKPRKCASLVPALKNQTSVTYKNIPIISQSSVSWVSLLLWDGVAGAGGVGCLHTFACQLAGVPV